VIKRKYPMNRENWIIQMYDWGQRGIQDYNHLHKKIIPASKNLIKKTQYGVRLKKLDPNLDVIGFDMPRNDIEKVKIKNGKIIRIGCDRGIKQNSEYFKKYIIPIINRSFTREELENIELYVEYPSKTLDPKFDGLSSGYVSDKNMKFSTIHVSRKKDAPTIVHEVLHAVRFEKNRTLKNINKDEAETDLETMMRLSKYERDKIPCNDGYYSLIKGDKCKARHEDAKVIEQNCNIRNKHELSKCIKRNLKKTNIGKLKIPKKFIPK
jgi:hypothetical protein